MIRRHVAPLGLLLLGAGCAQAPGRGPSLLPRAIESRSDAEPAASPDPVATPEPALDQRIAGIVADRDRADKEFTDDDRRLAAQLSAARRAAVGSDSWLDAQTALASLEAGRATVSGALTDLDEIAIQRTTDGKPPYPALEAARAGTQTTLDRLTTTLNQRRIGLDL